MMMQHAPSRRQVEIGSKINRPTIIDIAQLILKAFPDQLLHIGTVPYSLVIRGVFQTRLSQQGPSDVLQQL